MARFMGTRIFFLAIALCIIMACAWAYHHDENLRKNSMQVNQGDPNELVRQLLGDPGSEGPCGSLTAAPKECSDEYVYRYWFSVFHAQYEVVWFDRAGKVLGAQHVEAP
jgi:hypothetical protein